MKENSLTKSTEKNENLYYNTVVNLWKQLSDEINPSTLEFELEVYKKLINFFQVVEFYYGIFNLTTQDFDYVHPNVEQVLGFKPKEFNVKNYFECIHPEDRPWMANFENEAGKFLYSLPPEKLFSYKVQYDMRFKTKDGNWKRILNQAVTIQLNDNGGIFRTLAVQTDISHIKSFGKPSLSFIGLNGEPSFIDVQIGEPLFPFKEKLTKREKEILLHIIDGKLNKQIATILNISKETVDKHRKNMIEKANCSNSGELIAMAIKNGWI